MSDKTKVRAVHQSGRLTVDRVFLVEVPDDCTDEEIIQAIEEIEAEECEEGDKTPDEGVFGMWGCDHFAVPEPPLDTDKPEIGEDSVYVNSSGEYRFTRKDGRLVLV